MRAMILAAGLGTRMRSLAALRPKPALPIRGLPVLSHLLMWLDSQGVREVTINLHHLAEAVMEAAEAYRPPDMNLYWSREPTPLGTGGGIRRAAPFLRESDPSLVLAGDMLLDCDLAGLVARHRDREDHTTLVLREDPRAVRFGTVGLDSEDCVRRIGSRQDLGGETRSAVFIGARIFAARAFDSLPKRDDFEDLSDWLMPHLVAGARDIRGIQLRSDECLWEPVGTPEEYLGVNLNPPRLSYLDPEAALRRTGTRLEGDVVLGRGARLEIGAQLERSVVWDGESVPAGMKGCDGVFACGTFHSCKPAAAEAVNTEKGAGE